MHIMLNQGDTILGKKGFMAMVLKHTEDELVVITLAGKLQRISRQSSKDALEARTVELRKALTEEARANVRGRAIDDILAMDDCTLVEFWSIIASDAVGQRFEDCKFLHRYVSRQLLSAIFTWQALAHLVGRQDAVVVPIKIVKTNGEIHEF